MAGPYTRTNPFPAKLAVNRSLCGEASEKDTRHFEIDLKGWGLNYEVGDSMTVWPTNDPTLDAALRKVIQEQSGKTEAQTNDYVEKLKADKRYRRDVY